MVFLQEVELGEEEGRRKGWKAGSTFSTGSSICRIWPKAEFLGCRPETLDQPMHLHSSRMPRHCCLGQLLSTGQMLSGSPTHLWKCELGNLTRSDATHQTHKIDNFERGNDSPKVNFLTMPLQILSIDCYILLNKILDLLFFIPAFEVAKRSFP